MMAGAGGSWTDLRQRLISAGLMLAIGGICLIWGGLPLALLVAIATGVMVWELARLTAPQAVFDALGLGLGAALCLLIYAGFGGVTFAFLAIPAVALALTPRKDATLAGLAALALMLSAQCLLGLRITGGFAGVLWLVAVVVAADTAGYFAGRHFGGAKFLPKVSPNKTWAGTYGGWAAAAVIGLLFWLFGPGGWGLVVLSPLIAFAGQMGDIAESWLKRRAGVKDSSALIPGHGGVLDRFDALTGAAVALFVLSPVLGWPTGH